jgi:type II secretory pathway pseudopilin PulG
MKTRRHPSGFILIELIMTLILVGVIGAFTGLFLSTGIEGFIASKRNSEVAIKAQIAVDRLSAELRHVTQVTSWTPPSFSYKCSDPQLPGTRTLTFDNEIRISIDDGTPPVLTRVLMDDLDTFSMSFSPSNIDSSDDNSQELISLSVDFKLKDVGRTFKIKIFPRHFVPAPPP